MTVLVLIVNAEFMSHCEGIALNVDMTTLFLVYSC